MKIKEKKGVLDFMTKGFTGITLCPFGIFISKSSMNCKTVIVHEKIHWKQQLEMLVLFFYIWYLVEWLIRRVVLRDNRAYYNISFEKEAYNNEENPDYLDKRKMFNWLKLIK